MTDAQATDVEIYVSSLDRETAESWLNQTFETLLPLKKRKGMPKTAYPYEAQWRQSRFTVMIFENAAAGFTSLWFDHKDLPWSDDRACALVAAKHFNRHVRITAGGWNSHTDPDAWIDIAPDGTEKEIIWKD